MLFRSGADNKVAQYLLTEVTCNYPHTLISYMSAWNTIEIFFNSGHVDLHTRSRLEPRGIITTEF